MRIKRVYEPPAAADGVRILVDRLWPRGLAKDEAKIDAWMKDIAPSTALRQWYGHDPEKWSEFRRRYGEELDAMPDSVRELLQAVESDTLTLLYGTKEQRYNNAVALKAYLQGRVGE